MEKKAARAEIRRRIQHLTAEERAEKSRRASALLRSLPEFQRARCVLLFVSLPDEVDTVPLIHQALSDSKAVVLPRCEPAERRLALCAVRDFSRDLAPGALGIQEPVGYNTVQPGAIDLAIIPGRAFDERGQRLGRGAGYYDRLLADADFRAVRCGLVFEEQVLPAVPTDAHDEPVDIIVTDRAIRRPNSSSVRTARKSP